MVHQPEKNNKGLQTEIHHALRSSNLNLVRSKRANPYLQDDHHESKRNELNGPRRKILHLYEEEEITNQIEQLKRARQEELEQQAQEELRKTEEEQAKAGKIQAGELPAEDEEAYIECLNYVPEFEWWDEKYLCSGAEAGIHAKYTAYYDNLDSNSESDEEEEERPSIRFVKHPLPIKKDLDPHVPPKMYLTKQEQRKNRRNRRKLVQQEREAKIKLGLLPKPEAKVKLSNMWSAFENGSGILDPSQWEQSVREQVSQRLQKHLETNEQRREEARKSRKSKDLEKQKLRDQRYCKVYVFTRMANPKIRYKIVTNGRQLHLKGCCLHIQEGPGVMITIGDEKSCNFFEKLVTKRIQWSAPFQPKGSDKIMEFNDAKCELAWQGILGDHSFNGWFMKSCGNATELRRIVNEAGGNAFSQLNIAALSDI